MKKQITSAFSLVELTLALGIAAFCLIAVIGLVPVAVLTTRNATSQTAATNIMAAVVADLRATPKSINDVRAVRQLPLERPKHCTLMAQGSSTTSLGDEFSLPGEHNDGLLLAPSD